MTFTIFLSTKGRTFSREQGREIQSTNKFYTWGTTVNLASRLEAHSEPNYINVSEDVVKKLKELTTKFKYKYRGEFPIKNMGSVKMYFIEKS
ncbi:MAG: hypothetical protein JJT78_18140 [Leptospira sp.]|nr:hypothetical protein [Leptospira sp.]